MNWLELAAELLAAWGGTISFSVLFQVRARHYFWCGLVGSIGWLVYRLAEFCFDSTVLATFLATVVLSLCSRWFAALRRTPTLVFLICGIFTLVPGAAIYHCAYSLFMGEGAETVFYAALTLKLSIAIALGISAAYALPGRLFGWKGEAPSRAEAETHGGAK